MSILIYTKKWITSFETKIKILKTSNLETFFLYQNKNIKWKYQQYQLTSKTRKKIWLVSNISCNFIWEFSGKYKHMKSHINKKKKWKSLVGKQFELHSLLRMTFQSFFLILSVLFSWGISAWPEITTEQIWMIHLIQQMGFLCAIVTQLLQILLNHFRKIMEWFHTPNQSVPYSTLSHWVQCVWAIRIWRRQRRKWSKWRRNNELYQHFGFGLLTLTMKIIYYSLFLLLVDFLFIYLFTFIIIGNRLFPHTMHPYHSFPFFCFS